MGNSYRDLIVWKSAYWLSSAVLCLLVLYWVMALSIFVWPVMRGGVDGIRGKVNHMTMLGSDVWRTTEVRGNMVTVQINHELVLRRTHDFYLKIIAMLLVTWMVPSLRHRLKIRYMTLQSAHEVGA